MRATLLLSLTGDSCTIAVDVPRPDRRPRDINCDTNKWRDRRGPGLCASAAQQRRPQGVVTARHVGFYFYDRPSPGSSSLKAPMNRRATTGTGDRRLSASMYSRLPIYDSSRWRKERAHPRSHVKAPAALHYASCRFVAEYVRNEVDACIDVCQRRLISAQSRACRRWTASSVRTSFLALMISRTFANCAFIKLRPGTLRIASLALRSS